MSGVFVRVEMLQPHTWVDEDEAGNRTVRHLHAGAFYLLPSLLARALVYEAIARPDSLLDPDASPGLLAELHALFGSAVEPPAPVEEALPVVTEPAPEPQPSPRDDEGED